MRNLAIALLAACAPASAPPPASPAAAPDDRAALIAGMQHYDELVRAIDGHAIAAMFTADGVIANAGQTVAQTPAEIEKFLASFVGKVRVESTGSTVEHVRVDGDHGFIDGRYAQDARLLPGETLIHVSGRFTGEWLRDRGVWRIRKLETLPDKSAP